MDELKPCPFCGGKARTVRRWQSGDGTGKDIWIRCENCGVETIRYDTDEDAIAAWNRRAEPENKPLTMEGLKRMNHQPIWAVGKRSLGTEVNGWMLVDAKASRPAALDFTGACNFDSYSKTWLAYARKPEGDETP